MTSQVMTSMRSSSDYVNTTKENEWVLNNI